MKKVPRAEEVFNYCHISMASVRTRPGEAATMYSRWSINPRTVVAQVAVLTLHRTPQAADYCTVHNTNGISDMMREATTGCHCILTSEVCPTHQTSNQSRLVTAHGESRVSQTGPVLGLPSKRADSRRLSSPT